MEMHTNEMAFLSSNFFQIQIGLDFVAILVGVVAIYSLVRLNKKFGGKLSAAVFFFNLGMIANVLAILWSTFWGHTYLLFGVSFDMHHLFMTLGMILFILSTRKLSGLLEI